MEKKRWNYIDALRVLSLLMIVLYHYEVELGSGGQVQVPEYMYAGKNLHMAMIGVSLFFMISGFGLIYENRNGFCLKTYIKKRFIRIMIPFYVVSLLAVFGKMMFMAGPVFEETIPKWHIVFTLLGLDGYLKEYGIATFSLGVGEWFIGCIILMYLCFPLLRKAMMKNVQWTMGIATLCFLLTATFYKGEIPSYYFFGIKVYDFIVGMYLAMKLKNPSSRMTLPALAVVVSLLVWPYKIGINENMILIIFVVGIFVLFFSLESWRISDKLFGNRGIKLLSGYSYEIFLVHHWGIILMNQILAPKTVMACVGCFVVESLVIVMCGALLHLVLSHKSNGSVRKGCR